MSGADSGAIFDLWVVGIAVALAGIVGFARLLAWWALR